MTPTSSKRAWVGSKPAPRRPRRRRASRPSWVSCVVTPLRPGRWSSAPAMPSQPRAECPPRNARCRGCPARRAVSDDRISRPSVLHFPEPSGPPEGSRATLVPRIPGVGAVPLPPCRPTGICRGSPPGWAVGAAGDPQGLPQRPRRVRRVDVPQRRRRPRRASTACTCGATWRPSGRGSWPGPPSPARRPRCAATSPGRSGRVASAPIRPARCAPRRAAGRLPRVLSERGGGVAARRAGRDARRPARPGRARAPLRGRAARLGALRPRPRRHRPARAGR